MIFQDAILDQLESLENREAYLEHIESQVIKERLHGSSKGFKMKMGYKGNRDSLEINVFTQVIAKVKHMKHTRIHGMYALIWIDCQG